MNLINKLIMALFILVLSVTGTIVYNDLTNPIQCETTSVDLGWTIVDTTSCERVD